MARTGLDTLPLVPDSRCPEGSTSGYPLGLTPRQKRNKVTHLNERLKPFIHQIIGTTQETKERCCRDKKKGEKKQDPAPPPCTKPNRTAPHRTAPHRSPPSPQRESNPGTQRSEEETIPLDYNGKVRWKQARKTIFIHKDALHKLQTCPPPNSTTGAPKQTITTRMKPRVMQKSEAKALMMMQKDHQNKIIAFVHEKAEGLEWGLNNKESVDRFRHLAEAIVRHDGTARTVTQVDKVCMARYTVTGRAPNKT